MHASGDMCSVLVILTKHSCVIVYVCMYVPSSLLFVFCPLLQPAPPTYAAHMHGEVLPPRGINMQARGSMAPLEGGCHTPQLLQRKAKPHATPEQDSVPQRHELPSVTHSILAAQRSASTLEKTPQPPKGQFREDFPPGTVAKLAQEQKHVETTAQPPQPLSNSSKWSDVSGSSANMGGVGGFSPFAFFMVPMLACPSGSGGMLPMPMMMPYGNGEGGGMPFGFPGMKTEKIAGDSVSSGNEDEDEMQVVTIPEMKFLTRVPKKKQSQQKAISLDETQSQTSSQNHHYQQHQQPQPRNQLQQGQYQDRVSNAEMPQGRLRQPGTQQPLASEARMEAVRNHHQQQQQQPVMTQGSLPEMVTAGRAMPEGVSMNMVQQYRMAQDHQLLDDGSSSEEEEPHTDDDAPIILDDDDVQDSALEYCKLSPFQRRCASLEQVDRSTYMPPPQPHPRQLQKQQMDLHPEPTTSSPVASSAAEGYAITSLSQSIASEQTASISHSKLPIVMPPALMPTQGMSPGIPAQLLQQGPSAAQPSLLTLASAASSIAVEAAVQGSPQGPGSTQHQLLDAQR